VESSGVFAVSAAARGMASSVKAPSIKKSGSTLIVQPAAAHTATVVFMHGLGDTADGWVDTAASVFARALPHVKFILPTAETRPITINGGYPMPGWYDIKSLSAHRELESCDGIHDSRTRVLALVQQEQEVHGVPPGRVVLAGFSQGGAMSAFVGLNFPGPDPLAGIVVMSGYLPLPKEVKPSAAALRTPVLQCHGDEDAVVPLDYGRDCQEHLTRFGCKDVTFKMYEGLPHSANDAELLRDVVAFLKRVLPSHPAEPAKSAAAGVGTVLA